MKKVSGATWRALIHDPQHPWWEAEGNPDRTVRHVELLIDVCKAVYFANQRGVIHRDLKPDNVMVGGFGEVYVLDWGIAVRLEEPEESDSIVGTPAYMAPEMLDEREPLSAATDVYLLGACLHEVLTGEPRHTGTTMKEVLKSIHRSAPAEYATEIRLGEIANRACHPEPSERFATALELQRALAHWLRTRQAVALTEATQQRFDQVQAKLSGAAPSEDLRAEIRERFTECRFGFQQALELGDSDAQDGLLRCLRAMTTFEVVHGSPDVAGGLLRELRQRHATGIDGLERDHQAAVQKAQQVQQLAHDHDFEVASSPRQTAMAVFVLAALSLVISLRLMFGDLTHITPKHSFFIGLALLGLSAFIAVWFRKAVAASALNRSFVLVFLGTIGAVVVHRGLAWKHGLTIPEMIAGDLAVNFAGMIGAASLSRRLAPLVPLSVLGLVGGFFWPEAGLQIFSVLSLFTLVGIAWLMRSHSLDSRP